MKCPETVPHKMGEGGRFSSQVNHLIAKCGGVFFKDSIVFSLSVKLTERKYFKMESDDGVLFISHNRRYEFSQMY